MMQITKWNIEGLNGYKPITTFWQDFDIADNFGVAAVQDTYRRAFREWKHNYKYLTEQVLVLNHKAWQHVETNPVLSEVYVTLFETADNYAINNLKGQELDYFFMITD